MTGVQWRATHFCQQHKDYLYSKPFGLYKEKAWELFAQYRNTGANFSNLCYQTRFHFIHHNALTVVSYTLEKQLHE